MERPFAVELEHGLVVRRVASKSLVGDDVLAVVVAFGRTVPEEQSTLQSFTTLATRLRPMHGSLRMGTAFSPQFSWMQTWQSQRVDGMGMETCLDTVLELGQPIAQGRVCNAKEKKGGKEKTRKSRRESHADDSKR
jgi:hypothetical protein